jgi:hypothetical protein
VGVGELAPHERGERAPAAVRREHAHGHHACGRHLCAAWNGHVEEVRARAADDLVPVQSRKHALRGQDRPEPLDLLCLRAAAEVVPDRRERLRDLVGRGRADLDCH